MTILSKITNYLLYIFIFATVLGGSVVFSVNIPNKIEIIDKYKLSNSVYIDSNKLNNNLVIYKSNGDISNYKLVFNCSSDTSYKGHNGNNYYFLVKFNKGCDKTSGLLKNGDKILANSYIKFNLIQESKIFELYSDLNDNILNKYKNKLKKEIDLNINNYKGFKVLQEERKLLEKKYKYRILKRVLYGRDKKYKIPVVGGLLPTSFNKMPNSGRPYRQEYTDGVHHGWDFDTENNSPVISLDDAVVIRIVDGFNDKEYDKIVRGNDLSYEDKLKNLDILRGNQVWIKTTKGDVAFYSHLSEIRKDLKIGYIISRGEYIGKVGTTGVPVEGYDDYHLHIPIHVNYHLTKKAGKHLLFDYMKWNWYFKGKSHKYILEHQGEIFGE